MREPDAAHHYLYAGGRPGMNIIDLFFIFILIGFLALGFFQGMIRLGVMLLAFYLSVVLASLYFPMVGNWLYTNFGGTRYAGEYIGFFLIMLISFTLLAWAGIYTFRYAKLPGRLAYLDHAVGVFLGLILAALLIGILAVLLWNLMIVNGGRNVDIPLFRMIGSGVANSFLLNYFSTYILPETYEIVQPILPEGARIIFEAE
jgi:membrane protein required for colicin V production